MIGPSLPPELAAQHEKQRSPTPPTQSSESSSDEEVGPVPAPVGPASNTNSIDAAELAFRAKEQRMADARQAQDEADKAPPKRDEWMLKLPSGPSLQSLIGDPLKLKNRGFSQSAGPAARVQSRSTLLSAGVSAEGAQAWTETPAERQARMQAEVAGDVLPLSEQGPEILGESAAMARERQRAQLLREDIQRHDPSRSKSLLERHQERKEQERQRSKSSRSSRSSRHRRRSVSVSDDEKDRPRSDRHRPSHRSSHSSRSSYSSHPSHHSSRSSRSSRNRSAEDDKDNERSSHRSSHHHRSHSHHSTSSRHYRHRDRSASPRPSTGRKPIVWDRDAALGAGGKMLDDTAKARTISDAARLSDRFAGSGSSFL